MTDIQLFLHLMSRNLSTWTPCIPQHLHLCVINIRWKFTLKNNRRINQCTDIHVQIFIKNIQLQIFRRIIHRTLNIPSKLSSANIQCNYTLQIFNGSCNYLDPSSARLLDFQVDFP